jgi:hypothetical protein
MLSTVRFGKRFKSVSMISESQMESWYANSKHFIIEGNQKYCIPIFMSIQLKKYMRRFEKNGERNLVLEWYNMLEMHEKAEIEITPLN